MSTELVKGALDRWKKRLLDLSRRNRLLNFKPTKVSTLTFSNLDVAFLFRNLVLDQQKIEIQSSGLSPDEPEIGFSPQLDFASTVGVIAPPLPAGPPAGASGHLVASLEKDKLERSLRRISEQAAFVFTEMGVNILFLAVGFLEYFESADSDQKTRAPILLLPVALERQPRTGKYLIGATGEDPVLNPALVHLLERQFGIELPSLPAAVDDIDPNRLLDEIRASIRGDGRWGVTADAVLGLFAFHKLLLFKDLERNREVFAANEFILQLLTGWREPDPDPTRDGFERPLDERFPPEGTFQVVDADASQTKAIEAVAHGKSIVIIGPPGTGKSQTITNLIAHTLSQGKTVLFVSEKMAALKVVYDRLQGVGLSDFCLEIHSTSANKAAFYREIGRSLDRTLVAPGVAEASVDRLQVLRGELRGYAAAVHTPQPPLGITPFEAFGKLAGLESIPRLELSVDPMNVTAADLDKATRAVEDFAAAWRDLGDPGASPWRDATKTYLSREDQRRVLDMTRRLLEECTAFDVAAEVVREELAWPGLATVREANLALKVAQMLTTSPSVGTEILQSPEWNEPPAGAMGLIADVKAIQRDKQLALRRFLPGILEADLVPDIEMISRFHERPFRMLSPRYRAARRRWLGWRLASYRGSFREQLVDVRAVVQLQAASRRMNAAVDRGRGYFGAAWRGEESDWGALERQVDWVIRFRRTCVESGLGEAIFRRAGVAASDAASAERLAQIGESVSRAAHDLETSVGWPNGYLGALPVAEIGERVAAIPAAADAFPVWARFVEARNALQETPASEVAVVVGGHTVTPAELSASFRRSFLESWLDALVGLRPALRDFRALRHEQRIAEFRDLDRRILERNRSLLVGHLRSQTQNRLRDLGEAGGKRFLHAQIAKQRRHAPIRDALSHASPVVQAIKPCFMMSPHTVAQHLDGEKHRFDLVIFDEASQVTPEDAVGAVVRGRQLVIVGDPKQLPPTDFFMVESGARDELLDPDGEPVIEDMESILDQMLGARMAASNLKWHYRSRHESLIAFSNIKFYDAELCTFPSADTDTRVRGLQFRFVPEGRYEGAGINRTEARIVAEAVIEHARKTPDLTLGVGTFNLRQQIAIGDELERLRRDNPELEQFFTRTGPDAFFVKNLENIQGDDRDVIFLSVTYAKSPDGKLRHHFGPINSANGWRRLNVLITRARLKMIVFSSMHGDEIDTNRPLAAGARFLREFLAFAETGLLADAPVAGRGETESPFEYEVLRELTLRGIRCVPQVGVAGYRIDLGVIDDDVPGRYVCGIECDGATYHSAETARDRDRLRGEVLAGLGWLIHRVWSTDWFKDREGQINRLLERIARSRETAKQSVQVPESDPPPAPAPEAVPVPAADSAETSIPLTTPLDLGRLTASPYVFASLGSRGKNGVLASHPRAIQQAILEVVLTESPIHVEDIASRVATAFGDDRVGSKILRRIMWALHQLNSLKEIRLKDRFVWSQAESAKIRSRAGTAIPADRIAPEEYREAIIAILTANGVMTRPDLIAEVRGLFGFARTGAILESRISAAIEGAILAGILGEGSVGLGLRTLEDTQP
jgi:very-short-patch-repair endonuclease